MEKWICGHQQPYNAAQMLDKARGQLPLAWGHLVESGGSHSHQQAKGVASTMDNDNDGWEKPGETIPLA